MPLTDKQQRFVNEYLIDQNATQAYKRAGYKVRSDAVAQACSAKLLLNAMVRQLIDAGLAVLAKKTQLTAERAWEESKYISLSDIGEIIDFTGTDPRLKPVCEIPESARRAIKSVKIKRYVEGAGETAREVELMEFAFWDKPGQLNTTLRAHGEVKDKHEHSGPGGGAIPLHHTGNVTHDPTLEAADAAFAESLADSFTDTGEDHPADGGVHSDGGPESVDHERDPDRPADA